MFREIPVYHQKWRGIVVGCTDKMDGKRILMGEGKGIEEWKNKYEGTIR
jgi:hypothetical protein